MHREAQHIYMLINIYSSRTINDRIIKVGSARFINMLFTVYNRIKLQVDLQADKSPIIVKRLFFPRVVNPRYLIRGTNV
jgi:hypothetical protein